MMELTAFLFTIDILNKEFATDFRMLDFPRYEGKRDPLHHIQKYQMWMAVKRHSPATLFQTFGLTLGGRAFKWFESLRSGSLNSFEELHRSFLNHFNSFRERMLGKAHLRSIKQKKRRIHPRIIC